MSTNSSGDLNKRLKDLAGRITIIEGRIRDYKDKRAREENWYRRTGYNRKIAQLDKSKLRYQKKYAELRGNSPPAQNTVSQPQLVISIQNILQQLTTISSLSLQRGIIVTFVILSLTTVMILSYFLIPFFSTVSPTPTMETWTFVPTPAISELNTYNLSDELTPGSDILIWVNSNFANSNVEPTFTWFSESGQIIAGHGTEKITYRTRDNPGTCSISLIVEYGNWSTERSTSFVVTFPNTPIATPDGTPTPAPTETPIPTVPPPPPSPTPVPPTPTPTPTPTPCIVNPPLNWLPYNVEQGDTLSALADYDNSTIDLIQDYNCLQDYLIWEGQLLYLPALPTLTDTPTGTTTFTPTPITPTFTPTPITPTLTPVTITPILTPTTTTPTPTHTPTTTTPTNTLTSTPTPTATPTNTPTPTDTPSPITPTATTTSTSTLHLQSLYTIAVLDNTANYSYDTWQNNRTNITNDEYLLITDKSYVEELEWHSQLDISSKTATKSKKS